MRGGIGQFSHRLDIRDNVIIVTPNTHPNETSVLFLLFFLCIAVVVLAFVALLCISCRVRKINKHSNLQDSPLQPPHVVPGSSPQLQVTSATVAITAPVPARLKRPKPMMPKSMTRRDEVRGQRRQRYDYSDLRAMHAIHAYEGHYARENRKDHERARGLTINGT
ncbi:hypothetical protein SPBR_08908 [Sporothrix brasiliensis 5110]|uniref:Uncharacterized protein n=1 Tax=Sporothrix brasiliensis 5110 TaxID=1398154 RepID=A0A0C2IIB8_9PEZI|nr:uncharacterized protein SPBR_08908 [Sporothrix brasiliensis 5110]KIH86715.1 hypothetical protein SPBR_08908 [Sporothrix brasiliensis 5110]